jgi:hypothetical protein
LQQQSSKHGRNSKDRFLQCTVLQMLMNKKITSFHFPPDLMGSGVTATNLWQSLLAQRPPDLHTIVCYCINKNMCWDVRPFFNSLLPLYPNLEVLRLADNFYCTNQDLINISHHLPKLRSVLFLAFILFSVSKVSVYESGK